MYCNVSNCTSPRKRVNLVGYFWNTFVYKKAQKIKCREEKLKTTLKG